MKTNLIWNFASIMFAAAMLNSCSSDDEMTYRPNTWENAVSKKTFRPIKVEIGTRASITTTATLSTFNMYGASTAYTFAKEGTGWAGTPDKWPESAEDDDMVTFYANDGGTYDPSTNSVSFTMAEDAFNQKDFLVSTRTTSYTQSGGTVYLTFDHACAATKFIVHISNTLNTNLGASKLYFTSITLDNVKNSGKYSFASNSWTDVSGNSNYTLTNSVMEATTEQTELPCGNLFIIPQTLGENCTLTFNYKVGESGTEKSATISLNGRTLNIGEETIDIKLGTSTIKL